VAGQEYLSGGISEEEKNGRTGGIKVGQELGQN
jgi:hypothetical protein